MDSSSQMVEIKTALDNNFDPPVSLIQNKNEFF